MIFCPSDRLTMELKGGGGGRIFNILAGYFIRQWHRIDRLNRAVNISRIFHYRYSPPLLSSSHYSSSGVRAEVQGLKSRGRRWPRCCLWAASSWRNGWHQVDGDRFPSSANVYGEKLGQLDDGKRTIFWWQKRRRIFASPNVHKTRHRQRWRCWGSDLSLGPLPGRGRRNVLEIA